MNVSRIAEARDRARNMPKSETSSQRDFFLMQSRLRAMVADTPEEVLQYFNDRKQRADIDEDAVEAIEYGSAIVLQQLPLMVSS